MTTADAGATPGLSLPALDAAVRGRVIGPDHDEYDRARTVVVAGIDHRPAVIVKVADADDIALVVGIARDTELELAVRSGGHSGAGHSVTDGGIVIDVSEMKAIEIDVAARTAWAETGLTAAELTTAFAEHGLAVGFGDTGSVGIGGITLGGDQGAYVNFVVDEGEERVRAAYPGATWDRLVAIKTRYDPANLSSRNQNVPPAG